MKFINILDFFNMVCQITKHAILLCNKVDDQMKMLILFDSHFNCNTLEKITNNDEFNKLIVPDDLFNYSIFINYLEYNKTIKLLK